MEETGSHIGAMSKAQHAEEVLQLHQELLVTAWHSPEDAMAEAAGRKWSLALAW